MKYKYAAGVDPASVHVSMHPGEYETAKEQDKGRYKYVYLYQLGTDPEAAATELVRQMVADGVLEKDKIIIGKE